MARLENFDPTELPWEEWADGRPRRLKRGKHYEGSPRVVERAARAAASEMDRAVVTTVDQVAKWEYIWVQFVDQAVEEGQPCRCGGRHFARHHVRFARCEVCGRTTALTEPKEPMHVLVSTAAEAASPGDAPFGTITGVRVLSAGGEEVDRVPIDEEVVVEGTFEAPDAELRITPLVNVRTDVVRVFAASTPDSWWPDQAGVYRVEMRIPPDLLAAQSYQAEFRMRVMTSEGEKRLLPGVRVAFTAYDPAKEDGGREGLVRPRVDWAVHDEHGVELARHQPVKQPPEQFEPDDGIPGEG